MDRRKLLQVVLTGAAALLLMGHSPYRQWQVFRAKHLIVVTDDSKPTAFPLAKAVAAVIAARLPESKAMVAKAKTSRDVVNLLRSHQLQVGLLSSDDALAACERKGKFSEYEPVPLRTLALFGAYVLVVLDDYPREKAQQIAKTLAEHPGKWPIPEKPLAQGKSQVPFHPGVLDYYETHSSRGSADRAPPPAM